MAAKPPQNPGNTRLIRALGTIYGIVMINIGAFFLYDVFAAGTVVFGSSFRLGFACLLLGVVALIFARRRGRKEP